eukprot:172772-Rhodomonas_salina.12
MSILISFRPSHCFDRIHAARVITRDGIDINDTVTALSPLIPDVARSHAFMHETMEDTSLLNRVLYDQGSIFSGIQVFTTGQVGCYKAHVAVWEQIPVNETWMVLEGDAVVLPETVAQLQQLLSAVTDEYEYINLVHSNHIVNSNPSPVTLILSECPRFAYDCHVTGMIAYLVTYSGAQKLLQHAFPIQVPVDVYVTTFRDYTDPSFTFAFTELCFFGMTGRASLVGHDCFYCKLPRTGTGMLELLVGLTVGSLLLGILGTLTCWCYLHTIPGCRLAGSCIQPCLSPKRQCPMDDPAVAEHMLAELQTDRV